MGNNKPCRAAAQLARKVRKQIDGAQESKAGEAIAVDLVRAEGHQS